ncbi:MAG: 16S rRNA pseudouridine(516) synthase, partial [Treponema sp.]|nr:16S rRNA pseudouridine(516) synthase [Treponema sp.]
DDFTTCRVSVTEGKFHQIKRMFLAMGNEVVFLKRIAMGGLFLDQSLLPGQYRPLTDGELSILRGSL